MTPNYAGIDIYTHPLIPKDKVLLMGGVINVHPTTMLRMRYPRSPVWSTRTLGHRELERERRIRSKKSRGRPAT